MYSFYFLIIWRLVEYSWSLVIAGAEFMNIIADCILYLMIQDDSYLDSYISTIGVDFVSSILGLNICYGIYGFLITIV